MRERVLDTHFQILPLGITKVFEAVGAGRGAEIIAIGNGKQGQTKMGKRPKDAQGLTALLLGRQLSRFG